ncbi:hypothetical protein D3C84_1139280 [compost metagenome]
MQSPAWKKMDDDQRVDELNKLATKARAAVRVAAIPFISTGKRDALEKLRRAVQQESKQ